MNEHPTSLARNEDEAVHVTRAVVPEKAAYEHFLDRLFTSRRLTNHGEFAVELEQRLKALLGVPHLALCANGTLALQLALRASGLAGKEVIVTAFSYAATVSALLWEGCRPVFADIDEETLCLDPTKAAALVGPETAGILPVHIYGNACDVGAIDALAANAGLVTLYDAAQAFGSTLEGKSLLDFGDFAACSFHATKIFHTVEGGCVISRDKKVDDKLRLMRACGHVGDNHIMPGTNAKLSELHAAMGLALIDRVAKNIAGRKRVSQMYDALLPERGLRRPRLHAGLAYNYAYYPVVFEDEAVVLRVMAGLERENIHPRRYFYPALTTLPYLPERQTCPVAESVAPRVLCLPLYAELGERAIERVAESIKKAL